jgi:rod shape-determining protein MreC
VESLLNRYRNITVLLLVIMAQLVLLAVSAKNDQDVRFIRLWTVTAVTPVARMIEGFRGGSTGFLHNYILLHDTHQENQRLHAELDRMKMENVFLKNELNTAERAKALQVFQQHTQSKTVAATIIATGAGSNSKVVFVDRGTASGVQRGMAVVTPDGIVGKVIAAYPTASQVLLITDADFAAGVVFEKSLVHGTLKGQGTPQCKVDYVAFEEKVEPGEWVYTSGDDRIFPRGFRVGIVKAVRPGQPFKEILVDPSGTQRGLDDVLILIEGVHQRIPDAPSGMQPIYIAPAPPGNDSSKPADAAPQAAPGTEADRLRTQYQTLGEEQKHTYGENPPGTKPPDFTKLPNPGAAGQAPAGQANAPVNRATPPATPAPTKTVVPPGVAQPNPEVRKNPAPLPGTSPVVTPLAPKSTTSPTSAPPNAGTAGQTPASTKTAVPPAVTQPNPEVRKNPSSLPGTSPGTTPAAPSTTPSKAPAKSTTSPAPSPNGGTPGQEPVPGKSAAPTTVTQPNPEVRKNPSPPAGTPPVSPSATPPKTGPAVQPSGPAKNPPTPGAPPAKNPPDAARRVNQAAGVPPGGQPDR